MRLMHCHLKTKRRCSSAQEGADKPPQSVKLIMLVAYHCVPLDTVDMLIHFLESVKSLRFTILVVLYTVLMMLVPAPPGYVRFGVWHKTKGCRDELKRGRGTTSHQVRRVASRDTQARTLPVALRQDSEIRHVAAAPAQHSTPRAAWHAIH